MTPGDVAAAARVAAAAADAEHLRMRGAHDCGQSGDFPSLWLFFAANVQLWSASGVATVAEDDNGRVVGFAVGMPSSSDEPGLQGYVSDLKLLGVLPDVESKGVGSRLFCFAARALSAKACSRCWFGRGDGSERAQRFYVSRMGARGPLARKSVRCDPSPMKFDQLAFGWPEAESLLRLCTDEQPPAEDRRTELPRGSRTNQTAGREIRTFNCLQVTAGARHRLTTFIELIDASGITGRSWFRRLDPRPAPRRPAAHGAL
jgi:GNAT superfamily N-acetyltransferase